MNFVRKILCLALLFSASAAQARSARAVGAVVNNVVTTLTDGPTVAWDASTAFGFKLTLGGNRAIQNPTGLVAGALYTLELQQDGSGSRVATWGTNFRWTQNAAYTPPTFSTAAYAVDHLLFYSDGTYLTLLSVMLNVYSRDVAPAPSSLTASTDEAGQITLNWTDTTSDEAGFIVEYDNLSTWTEIGRTAAGVHSFVDPGLPPGDGTYRVRAFRPGAVSSPSNSATGTAL
jgi:hypothetical protein